MKKFIKVFMSTGIILNMVCNKCYADLINPIPDANIQSLHIGSIVIIGVITIILVVLATKVLINNHDKDDK